MHLKSLKLEQFRNYSGTEIKFGLSGPVTFIVGDNAQGKTNILEAIYLLSLTKSFRTVQQENLIKWGEQFARVKGVFESKNETFELEVFIGSPPHPRRALKKNGVKISTYNFIGNCQIVFFHPEDLNILYLGPDLRRRYLDIVNIQINPAYYRALRAYRRILEQRNSLLKKVKEGSASASNLNIWDEQLIKEGTAIMTERKKSIDYFNRQISDTYQRISKGSDKVFMEYNSFFDDENAIADSFKNKLAKAREKDLKAEFTTVGPHRDDFNIKLNNKQLASHASRGEYRSILLSLKLIECIFYGEKTKEKPILLLDDVFSELDMERQKMLLENISGYQTILTSTRPANLPFERDHRGLDNPVIKIREGNIATQ